MEFAQTLFLPALLILFYLHLVSASHHHHHHHHHHDHHHHHHHSRGHDAERYLFAPRPTKLFVFGDSYSATGNNRKAVDMSWEYPYGITFPGKPTGRFSDGRVLTDFLAKFIGVKSPMPYAFRKVVEAMHLKHGMNFAHGGTGVFNTLAPYPNMTTQIDYLHRLIKDSVFTPKDLQSSVALLTVSGNDYATYAATNGSPQGWQTFITAVVSQLSVDLKRIYDLGMKKVVVTSLEPLGCLPTSTVKSSFKTCNGTENLLVSFHNLLLQQAVANLNNQTKKSSFIILDLYASFMSVFKNKGDHLGSIRFENPLRPCCIGISNAYHCGSVDGSGAKKYTICEDPKSTFFWDAAHPTEQGWRAVYSALQATLLELF